jgi:putative oxygen-independent coproporphyrinogen III oxidase
MNDDRPDAYHDTPGAYVHLPFCTRVCPYCDFAVVAGKDDLIERYVEAVIAEIGLSPRWGPLSSVYVGGGTPSHLRPELLGRIVAALASRHGIAPDAEVSLEANPEDFDLEMGRTLVSLGFNRVSFGAQSMDRRVLSELGRRHGPDQISEAVRNGRVAGLGSVSVDLIFGSSTETDGSWDSTLEAALALEPDHVSCYALTAEPGTPLGRQVASGAPGPDPDTQADRYESAQLWLAAAGYGRYEVSNWSRPGHECRYNLTVWAQGEYEAFGNGAHRFRDGARAHNVRRVEAYIDRVESGVRPTAGVEPISGWDMELDRLFVGLRRTAGVALGPGTEALARSEEGRMLADQGVIAVEDGRLKVLRPLLTDEVLRSVLGLPAPSGRSQAVGADNV